MSRDKRRKDAEYGFTLGDCYPCPYGNIGAGCRDKMSEDALALINSQEQRIGELAEENERLENICQSYALQYGTVTDKEVFLKKERADTVRKMQAAIIEYYSKPKYQPTREHPIRHTQIEHLFAVIDQIAKEMLEGKE